MTVERLSFAPNLNLLPVRFNGGISFISSSTESAIKRAIETIYN